MEPEHDGFQKESPFPGAENLMLHVKLLGCILHMVTEGEQSIHCYEGNPLLIFTISTVNQCLGRAQITQHKGSFQKNPNFHISFWPFTRYTHLKEAHDFPCVQFVTPSQRYWGNNNAYAFCRGLAALWCWDEQIDVSTLYASNFCTFELGS